MKQELPPFEYLLACSRNSLQSFLVAKLNKAANDRKQIREILEEWVETQALAMLAEWFSLHGEELIAMAALPPEERRATERKSKEHANEKTLKPFRYEFWRSEQRHNRRKAG